LVELEFGGSALPGRGGGRRRGRLAARREERAVEVAGLGKPGVAGIEDQTGSLVTGLDEPIAELVVDEVPVDVEMNSTGRRVEVHVEDATEVEGQFVEGLENQGVAGRGEAMELELPAEAKRDDRSVLPRDGFGGEMLAEAEEGSIELKRHADRQKARSEGVKLEARLGGEEPLALRDDLILQDLGEKDGVGSWRHGDGMSEPAKSGRDVGWGGRGVDATLGLGDKGAGDAVEHAPSSHCRAWRNLDALDSPKIEIASGLAVVIRDLGDAKPRRVDRVERRSSPRPAAKLVDDVHAARGGEESPRQASTLLI
jgi:hypothetical protein